LKKSFNATRAICTFLFGLTVIVAPAQAQQAGSENLAQYEEIKLATGAKTLPVLARLAGRDASILLRTGDLEGAEKKLQQALAYDPLYIKAHLWLSFVKLRQLDPEAAVYLIEAVSAIGQSFRAQTFLLLNVVLAIPYVLVLVSLIVCMAFGIKYLPFAAHRVREFLQARLRAALPGLAAYLILLLPLILLPGAVPLLAYLTVVCWLFMYRRERFLLATLLVPFILFGFMGSLLRPLAPLSDTKSLTSLIATANDASGESRLISAIDSAPASGLEAEKNISLGLLYQRAGVYTSASDHYYKAISLKPDDTKGYINLGNMYFLQGIYDKALEGYRKAESIDAADPVTQHALAQAYIKTLLMKEASKSLQASSALGLEDVESSYATAALEEIAVFPKTFSSAGLWKMAVVEGQSADRDPIGDALYSLMRVSPLAGAWILLCALAIALVLGMVVDPSKLTFQCSNCGKLTCQKCCNTDRETVLCQECASTVSGVTSEKVTEALLRQKRQLVIVNRRRASRFITILLPGMRDISYGEVSRGFRSAVVFSIGVVYLAARGLLVHDDMSFPTGSSPWYLVLPAALIVLSYGWSMFSKPQYNFKAYGQPKSKGRHKEKRVDIDDAERVA